VKWQGLGLFLLGVALLGAAAVRETCAAVVAELEGPANGQAVAGVSIIRGWAFSDTAGVSITAVTLLVDGSAVTGIPCCSERGDEEWSRPRIGLRWLS
jgi:hypothetical protein